MNSFRVGPAITRRDFLRAGVSALAPPLILGCSSSPSEQRPPPRTGNPRLIARLGTPAITPSKGLSQLGLGGARDGQLYVPQSYSPDTPMPLFVALHGAGGSGSSWSTYPARAEPRGMILLAPDSRSQTWDLIRGDYSPDVEFLDQALAYTFERCNIDPAKVALGGFSDGASYALSLGTANGDLFSHLVAYSPGFHIRSNLVGKPRVFISHGEGDTVLPVVSSRDTIVPALLALGYDVTYREFDGGHEVPSAISDEALDWFLA